MRSRERNQKRACGNYRGFYSGLGIRIPRRSRLVRIRRVQDPVQSSVRTSGVFQHGCHDMITGRLGRQRGNRLSLAGGQMTEVAAQQRASHCESSPDSIVPIKPGVFRTGAPRIHSDTESPSKWRNDRTKLGGSSNQVDLHCRRFWICNSVTPCHDHND